MPIASISIQGQTAHANVENEVGLDDVTLSPPALSRNAERDLSLPDAVDTVADHVFSPPQSRTNPPPAHQ